MFLSRLSDIVEPRHRTEQGSRFFSQLKISYQKIEIFARIVDLLLTGVASIVGRGLCQHVWHENFATAEVCMGAGLINGLLYIYAVNVRGLYRLPVLLVPIPYFSRLIAVFACHGFFGDRVCAVTEGQYRVVSVALGSTLLLQLILLGNCPLGVRPGNAYYSVRGKPRWTPCGDYRRTGRIDGIERRLFVAMLRP